MTFFRRNVLKSGAALLTADRPPFARLPKPPSRRRRPCAHGVRSRRYNKAEACLSSSRTA